MVDPPFFAPQNQRALRRLAHLRASIACGLRSRPIIARFRLAPPQACDNLFILDFIARRSVRKAIDAEGSRWLVTEF